MNTFKIVSISCGVTAIILAILLGILPFLIESNLKSKSQIKTNPTMDNTKLWANFPGDLKTSLNHIFTLLAKEGEETVLTKASSTFKESIAYEGFISNEDKTQITFEAKRSFEQVGIPIEEPVKTISMGMMELLNTISNPPNYKEGIASIIYLLNHSFGLKGDFNRKLFTMKAFKEIIGDPTKLTEMLKGITDEAKKKKIKEHSVYGIEKSEGLFQWIIILNKSDLITKATWLKDKQEGLGLTNNEIDSLLGLQSMLYLQYIDYELKLKTMFFCKENPCGIELIFNQLIDKSVVSTSESRTTLSELLKDIHAELFPFKQDPEMESFFIISQQKGNYADVKLTIEQLTLLLDPKSPHVLSDPSNAIKLLQINQSQNLDLAKEYYQIKSIEQLNFITIYFFIFLPDNYLYSVFETNHSSTNNQEYHINSISKAFTSILQMTVDNTYGKLIENGNLSSIIIAKLVSIKLFSEEKTEEQIAEFCPMTLQKVIGDGRKVLEICNKQSDLSLTDYRSLKVWIQIYLCHKYKCDSDIVEKFIERTALSSLQLDALFSKDSLGEHFIDADNKMKEQYECGERCSEERLARLQYTKCEITKNPPAGIPPVESISEWDIIEFPFPIELKYYQNKAQCKEENCNAQSNEEILSLYNHRKLMFDLAYLKNMHHKLNLEKIFSLFIEGIFTSEYSTSINIANTQEFFIPLNTMIANGLFKNTIYNDYSRIESILFGNNKEDGDYITLLRQGNNVEFYNPKAETTTGFNLGIGKSLKNDKYTIETQQDDKQTLRAIRKMNDDSNISIIKEEYSLVKDQLVQITTPLYEDFKLNGDKWMSDGFQYSATLDNIYFYDHLSSRLLEFNYNTKRRYNDEIPCYEYILNQNIGQNIKDKGDISKENFGEASQKFNKPFVLSTPSQVFSKPVKDLGEDNSFICVDPYSNMVIESNITLIYSIYTKNYNYLNSLIPKDTVIPFAVYKRTFSVDQISYVDNFKGVTGYFMWRIILIVLGVIFIAACVALAVFFWWKSMNASPRISNMNQNILNEDLIPDSKA